jgi:MoaA/NifB/PqqE/SkfB family radical SAM enzyme
MRARTLPKKFRVPLGDLFSRISIETRTDCNLKCDFCPQSTNPRPKLQMSDRVFTKVIDELADMRFAGRIAPLVNNEPLLDERILRFVAYARQKCPLSFLDLVTNGTLLAEKLMLELFAAGLDRMTINDYRRDRAKHPLRLSTKLSRIAQLSENMYRQKIFIVPRSSVGTLSNRAGNVPGLGVSFPLKQFCALPFTGIWINPEGKAILCCQDYCYEEIMGDVTLQSLSGIWFGDKYVRVRAELHRGDRTLKICEKCDYSGLPLE